MGFGQFYANGGVWMHAITLTTLFSGLALVAHQLSTPSDKAKGRHLELVKGLAGIGVLVGLMGSLFGSIDLFAVLRGLEAPANYPVILGRAGAILVAPLLFSLMCAVPSLAACVALRFVGRAEAKPAGAARTSLSSQPSA